MPARDRALAALLSCTAPRPTDRAEGASTSLEHVDTVRVLDRIVATGRRPELLRSDNGPELTANALRDWCRLGGSGQAFIEPGSPSENPFVESFGSRVRDEVLSVEAFGSLAEAAVVLEDWRNIYNTQRPHGSLGWKTSAAYAASWRPN